MGEEKCNLKSLESFEIIFGKIGNIGVFTTIVLVSDGS